MLSERDFRKAPKEGIGSRDGSLDPGKDHRNYGQGRNPCPLFLFTFGVLVRRDIPALPPIPGLPGVSGASAARSVSVKQRAPPISATARAWTTSKPDSAWFHPVK